jgi:putative protein-disulfide isomerase
MQQGVTMTLHYIFDPLCGWCYAAAPLLQAARTIPDLDIALHGGGMMIGPNRRTITPQWRDYVVSHDKRIAQMTGQHFGEQYYEGLLRNNAAVLDSEPPTTAILAAEEIDGKGAELLARLQEAHYVDGKVISDQSVLIEEAVKIGLPETVFKDTCARLQNEETLAHILESRQLLSKLGAHGFPTFAIEQDGKLVIFDVGPWLGKADAWKQKLMSMR